jgi:hypothetical protein
MNFVETHMYGITISIPYSKNIRGWMVWWDVSDTPEVVEDYFIKRRDAEPNYLLKVQHDRARASIKFAHHLGGVPVRLWHNNDKLCIDFTFKDIDSLISFNNEIGVIESDTMKHC